MNNQCKRISVLSLLLTLVCMSPAISQPTLETQSPRNQEIMGRARDDIFSINNREKTAIHDLIADSSGETERVKKDSLDPQYELFAKEIFLYFDNKDGGNGRLRPQVEALLDQQGYAINQVFDNPNTSFQALALRSKDGSKPPVLVFQGSAASGNSADVGDFATNADPRGVGFSQFFANKQVIQAWLITITHDQKLNPQGLKPDVTGTSLGGALTQWTASEFPTLINSAISFQSTGIAQDAAHKFIEHGGNPHQVKHYIVNGDYRSLIGENFIPGKVVISVFDSNERDRANYFDRKHLSGILADSRSIIPDSNDPLVAQLLFLTSKPANQSLSEISVDELNQPNFTFQGKDGQIGLEIARANDPNFVVDRQRVEALRRSDINALLKIFRISQ